MHDLTPEIPFANVSALNDRDLLRRFVQDADETAFTEIVRRHQGLVMGVCRRVIGNSTDVDDAFQATFIALARRPRQIRHTASLSSWLYTVAWRTSIRLVRQRRKHLVEPLTEQTPDKDADTLHRIASAQDCLVLDEELNDLPQKYREVLVMTYFAGQGSQHIADQLNVSKGTVDGRIRQARNMLRVRLARRGVAIGVLTVAAGLSTTASAATAPALLESTIQLGAQTLSGSLPGTTDLSHLEPFIRPETTMLSAKLLISGVLSATAIVGIAGMSGLSVGDEDAAANNSAPQLQTGVSAATDDGANALQPLPVTVSSSKTDVIVTIEERSTTAKSDVSAGSSEGVRRFNDYPSDAQPVERWMYEMLEKPLPVLDFPGETPLSEILETIQTFYTETYGAGSGAAGANFRMTIFPDYAELQLEGITHLEEVTVSDINLEGMTLRNALTLIFGQTTEPELTYMIENEVLKVTTLAKAESEDSLITRVYSVGELLDLDYSPRAAANGSRLGAQQGVGKSTALATADAESSENKPAKPSSSDQRRAISLHADLTTTVMDMTSPGVWSESGGAGTICIVGRSLIVRQTPGVHHEIIRLLNLLSESEGDGPQFHVPDRR